MPYLWGKRYDRLELLRRVGGLEQVAGVRLVTLGDGAERGLRVLEFRTGSGFAFEVLVDRAFDVGRCELKGKPLGWLSGVGFAGPWYQEPQGLGFFRTWGGGLLTTAGLDHTLFMAEDTAEQYHYPPKQTETFGLHGRISNRPARLTGYGERWDDDGCVLWAEGEVLQAAVFGEHLLLRRRIEARIGESRLKVHDEVENVGHNRTPHMYLYHVNVGFPAVSENSELLSPAVSVEARGDYPTQGYEKLHAPEAGYVEQVFEHELAAEEDGTVPVAVVNREMGFGVYQLFDKGQFPHHFMWKMLGEGTYAVGIEPSTNRTAGRLDARERGELIKLEAGEKRTYDLELGALGRSEDIDAFAARIEPLSEKRNR
ncbi:MAG: aldose 1-epimerase family protein [Rubrobacteraceae bacterium]